MIELKLNHMTLNIDLPDGVSADPKLLDGGHPLHYVLKMRKQTENYLNKVHELLADLPPMDVLEFCAGIGLVCASNLQLKESFSADPAQRSTFWCGVELDENCMSLADAISPDMQFHLGDMYDPEFTNLWQPNRDDLIILEYPTNTLPKMWREPKRKDMLERVFGLKPRYVYIADVGYYWIHLANHWPLYQARFGVKPTRENYHELFDRYARETWGYKVSKWTVGGGAQYFLLEVV